MRPGQDRGSVTAEFAIGLPSVLVVLGAVLAVGSLTVGQLQVVNGAVAAARGLARGESPSTVEQVACQQAGRGCVVVLTREGALVSVTVSRRVSLAVPGQPTLTLRWRSVARAELGSEVGAGVSDG